MNARLTFAELVALEPRLGALAAEIEALPCPAWYEYETAAWRAQQYRSLRLQGQPPRQLEDWGLECVCAADEPIATGSERDPYDRRRGFRWRMIALVGYLSRHPDPRLHTCEAYDTAYRHLYELCRQRHTRTAKSA